MRIDWWMLADRLVEVVVVVAALAAIVAVPFGLWAFTASHSCAQVGETTGRHVEFGLVGGLLHRGRRAAGPAGRVAQRGGHVVSLLRTLKLLILGDDSHLQRERPRRSPAGVEYSPPAPDLEAQILQGDGADEDFRGVSERPRVERIVSDPTGGQGRYVGPVNPATVDLVRRFQENAEAMLLRPDVVVGQTLAAAYDYLAANGWLDRPRPKVLSTAPADHHGRVVLVITDPPKLDPDLWKQLRDRDQLTCVVRP